MVAMDLEYYTPNGTDNLLSLDSMKKLLATGVVAGAVFGIAKAVGTESKSATSGAVESLSSTF